MNVDVQPPSRQSLKLQLLHDSSVYLLIWNSHDSYCMLTWIIPDLLFLQSVLLTLLLPM